MHTTPLGRATARRSQRWLQDEVPESGHKPTAANAAPKERTPDHVRAAVVEAMQEHLCDHYVRRPGLAPLCQEIAARLAACDVSVDADAGVVIAAGAEEARYFGVRALAEEATATHLFIPRNAQAPYQIAAEFAGATVTGFDPQGALPEVAGGLLVFPTINAETGQPYSEELLARLEEWAIAADLTLVADEIEAPLLAQHNAQTPLAARVGLAQRTLTLGSFSSPGLAAWRVAWFAGPNALVATVRAMKQAMTICSPAPGQYAALASLQGGD